MSVEIKQINDRAYIVKGKNVYKDMEDRWIYPPSLSDTDVAFFERFIVHVDNEKKSSSKSLPFVSAAEEVMILDLKIDNILRQKDILETYGEPFEEEKLKLRNYYENKLNSYKNRRDTLIKSLPVRATDIKAKCHKATNEAPRS